MAASPETERALSLLGMARRARELLIGQDMVLAAARSGRRMFIMVSDDCSPNVLLRAGGAQNDVRVIKGVSREELGAALGVTNAQITALPDGSGFVKKLKDLLK
jgi:ribosomal protein L7Ae-like RNA K-turn-binding protein